MPLNKNAENLKILLAAMSEDHLSRSDFNDGFRKVMELVKQTRDENAEFIKLLKEMFDKLSEQVKGDTSSEVETLKGQASEAITGKMSQMEEMHNQIRQMVDDKLASIMDGQDGKDADEQVICDKVCEMVQEPIIEKLSKLLPKLGEPIRDGLELLQGENRQNIDSIDGLRELLEEIKSSRGGARVGGTGPMVRFIDDETPTGTVNGVNTTFTLSKTPLDGSLKVFRGGARQRITQDYTLASKTITFLVAPVVGEILLVDFRY